MKLLLFCLDRLMFKTCRQIVKNLFTRRTSVEKWGAFEQIPTSYERFFYSLRFPDLINISTGSEEEEILYISIKYS